MWEFDVAIRQGSSLSKVCSIFEVSNSGFIEI